MDRIDPHATNLVVLAGNGVSVAVNRELSLGSLTEAMLIRIAGDGSLSILREHLGRLGEAFSEADPTTDFEALIGVLQKVATVSTSAEVIATALNRGSGVADESKATSKLVSRTHRQVEGLVLELIFERMRGLRKGDRAPVQKLLKLIDGSFPGNVTIANLNYDSILMSAALSMFEPKDLVDLTTTARTVTHRGVNYRARTLATHPDFEPSASRRILQLHGSVQYWHTSGGKDVKLRAKDLNVMEAFAEPGRTELQRWPLALLDGREQKSERVKQFPYSVAYTAFRDALRAANRLLIVGYSFRDIPVNDAITRFFARQSKTDDRILIVDIPRSSVEQALYETFNINTVEPAPATWLRVSRSGVSGIATPGDPAWDWFTA